MFKLLSLFLISVSMTNANCLPVVQKDIIVLMKKNYVM